MMRKADLIVAILGLVATSLIGFGVAMLALAPQPVPTVQAKEPKELFNRDDLRSKLIGKTPDEVIAVIGEPATKMYAPDGYPHWLYMGRTANPDTGVPDMSLILHFLGNTVYDITF